MSEDSAAMDKKNFTPSSKKLDTSRSRQDGTGSNQLEKINRSNVAQSRHDSPSSSSNAPTTRPEPPLRNSGTQKSKVVEKKPRVRERNSPPQSTMDNSDEPEVGSLQTPGSRKQNMNQWLQFVFAPRENNSTSRRYRSQNNSGDAARQTSGGSLRLKFNKEHFIQSRCQFLVSNLGDYKIHNYNPDLLVNWDLVEQVNVRVSDEKLEKPVCPICLSTPVAAKITKCGHIYCWTCLLHYFALSDKKARNCPTCYESIEKQDLRSVVVKVYKDVKVGQEVEMQLMYRPKGSLYVEKFGCVNEGEVDSSFSQLIAISTSQVKNIIIQRELNELKILLEEQRDMPEVCFVQEALVEVACRQTGIKNSVMTTVESQESGEIVCEGAVGDSVSSTIVSKDPMASGSKHRSDSGESNRDEIFDSFNFDKCYFFYQATDGQNAFMHPINMAMIRKEFGSDPSVWPAKVKCAVVEVEDGTITEELRKRLKFVAHMPLTSPMKLVELDLKPVVSVVVEKMFSAQLGTREQRRMDREMNEKRRERLYERAQKNMTRLPPGPKIESEVEFPYCGFGHDYSGNDEHEEVHKAILRSLLDGDKNSSSVATDAGSSSTILGTDKPDLDYPQLAAPSLSKGPQVSFAQAAAAGQKFPRSPTFPITQPRGSVNRVRSLSTHSAEDPDDDYSAPQYRASVSDAIEKAFASAALQRKEEQQSPPENRGSKNKKKGRKKGTVLFATGVGLGGN